MIYVSEHEIAIILGILEKYAPDCEARGFGSRYKKKLSFAGTRNKTIYKTDLVFGMSREILNWGIMRDAIGSVSAAYNVFLLSNNINSEFLKSFIKSHSTYFKDLIKPSSREG
jgi:type I restriction enzyme S subunit